MAEEKKTEEGINAKLDWSRLIFEQCRIIDNSTTPGEFRKNIDLLWCKLSPYEDKQYEQDIDKALSKLKEKTAIFIKTGAFEKDINSLVWQTILAEYSALMKLAFRQKILPQRLIPHKQIGEDKKNMGTN